MPWQERSRLPLRSAFVALASAEDATIQDLCWRYTSGRKTAYKWLARLRAAADDPPALADRARRPHTTPRQTPAAVAAAAVAVRDAHPAWGGRKMRAVLQAQGQSVVPRASTSTAVLRRADRLAPPLRPPHAVQRFAAPAPNSLWQRDCKGHIALQQGRCHPLTAELLHGRTCADLRVCQQACDRWRDVYNLERPQEALPLVPPAQRSQPRPRQLPERLPPLDYPDAAPVRRGQAQGELHFRGRV